MPLVLFARRDPWWEIDGPAARRERRRRRVVSFAAFLMSLFAVTGSVYVWAFHLGFVGGLALRFPLG
jgi:hypothetical protein